MFRFRHALALGALLTTLTTGITAFAADGNFSYGNIVGMENYLALSDTVRTQVETNMKNLPDSLLDLHKRYGATINFVDGSIPKAYRTDTDKTVFFGEHDNNTIGITYLSGDYENDIYVRTDDKAVYNYYGTYWRTLSHELGHFAKHVTYDFWTEDMKAILAEEYLLAKDKDSHCYSEEETFAHEYSLYCESDRLVSNRMCTLFRNVEALVKMQDIALGGTDIIDPVRTDNIVKKIEYNPMCL